MLLCPLSTLGRTTSDPLQKRVRSCFCDDRATVGASPETSVINLLFAGSRTSVLRLGAVPVCHRASILRSATSIAPGIPLAVAALPPLHEAYLHRSHAPAQAPCL